MWYSFMRLSLMLKIVFVVFIIFCDDYLFGGVIIRGSSGGGNDNGDIIFIFVGSWSLRGNGNIVDFILIVLLIEFLFNDEEFNIILMFLFLFFGFFGVMFLWDVRYGLLSWIMLVLLVYMFCWEYVEYMILKSRLILYENWVDMVRYFRRVFIIFNNLYFYYVYMI